MLYKDGGGLSQGKMCHPNHRLLKQRLFFGYIVRLESKLL